MAGENSKPTRVIAGQKTLLSRTMHDVRYDEKNDEFWVNNPFARALLAFRGGADGEEPPVRIIQGSKTRLGEAPNRLAGGPDRLEVDNVHDEVYVAEGERIFVYPRTANGNVAPLRVIEGPDTGLQGFGTAAVDPHANVLVVAQDIIRAASGDRARIFMFDRTANGNVKPIRVIYGPKTGITRINQMQIYSPKGWIVASQPGFVDAQRPEDAFVGIWSIHDNGDVPPRWKIGGPNSGLVKPRGVALNVKNKEVIVGDMRLNSVMTFYFPELF
jgi:hypothetical protein